LAKLLKEAQIFDAIWEACSVGESHPPLKTVHTIQQDESQAVAQCRDTIISQYGESDDSFQLP